MNKRKKLPTSLLQPSTSTPTAGSNHVPIEIDDDTSTNSFNEPSEALELDKVREALAHMILMDELPLTIVESDSFNSFVQVLQPFYKRSGVEQVKEACERIFEAERRKLKTIFANVPRINVTTDLWKSEVQDIEYMEITAHWVDHNWSLQNRVINFVHLPPPRRGVDIAYTMINCFKDWGIEDKVCAITVDNSTINDACLVILKEDFEVQRRLLCDGKLFHVRCIAHFVNLLVEEGVEQIKEVIETIRESVKYISYCDVRQKIFCKIARKLGIKERKLILDCPTMWNSTYRMLSVALRFKDVFPRYQKRDHNYSYCPSVEEWEKVAIVCDFFQIFHDVSNIVSRSENPTSNLYFIEVFRIKEILQEREFDPNPFVQNMISKMRSKFDKYWGEVNLLMALASTLDPRIKFRLIEFVFPILYGDIKAKEEIQNVKKTLETLYGQYMALIPSDNESNVQTHQSSESDNASSSHTSHSDSLSNEGWQRLKEHIKKVEYEPTVKSELDVYLEEGCMKIDEGTRPSDFDALKWWRDNQLKYKVLSQMAAEILAIPVSSVAPEEAFRVGSRVIDCYWETLDPETVNMLLCGGDWIRAMHGVKKPQKVDDSEIEISCPIK